MTARAISRRRLAWRPVQFDFAGVDGERGHLGLMVAELEPGRFTAMVLEQPATGGRGSPIVVGDRKTRAEAQRLCRDFAREWKQLPALQGSSLAAHVAAARVDRQQQGDPSLN